MRKVAIYIQHLQPEINHIFNIESGVWKITGNCRLKIFDFLLVYDLQ